MKISFFSKIVPSLLAGFIIFQTSLITAQVLNQNTELDKKVEKFLEKHKYKWHDLNIPTADGKILYDLIIKNNYKNAIEIGTSTGHSAIWIAWALSKTGGKLTTIEINKSRHQKALANFKEAGLEKYMDARLDDAHKLVPKLKGPIDFVFCDADKGWYKNYFKDMEHEIVIGGCFTAHNISMKQNTEASIKEFLEYVKSLSNFNTTIENEVSSGISISYKTGHR